MKTANEMKEIMKKVREKELAERIEKARQFVEGTLELKFIEEANKGKGSSVIEVEKEIADDVAIILTENGYKLNLTNAVIAGKKKYLVCWVK